ncbi:IncA family protein [Halobellus sp. Atlit-38R]|uniref:IncA family protein n=1 Tax=Halobellus sp. Atlit-38R TaxID=2282131 RepID=UPI000EF1CB25|nr:IncA family protein [Halobellus sp. Atlit-38R]RLM88661.1 IncA family protein [Halobellus sp. Atlit-38R]
MSESATAPHSVGDVEATATASDRTTTSHTDERTIDERLAALEAQTDRLQERVATLEAERDALQEQVTDLEADREALQSRVQHLERERDDLQTHVEDLETELQSRPTFEFKGEGETLADLWVDGRPLFKSVAYQSARVEPLVTLVTGDANAEPDDIDACYAAHGALLESESESESQPGTETDTSPTDALQALRDRHATDHADLKHHLAKLRRQLTHLATETGVELVDAIPGDDKIATVKAQGVAAVESHVSATAERAERIITDLTDWARKVTTQQGTYAQLTAPQAREKFALTRDEHLQTTQIKRVFEKISSWAADSPRDVAVRKNPDGVWRLQIAVEPRGESTGCSK